MTFPIYLAMTALEFGRCSFIPAHCGWMACHFSSYGNGLTNIPRQLPENSLLILNDRISPQWHDPETVVQQLCDGVNRLQPAALLLDLQRPFDPLTFEIVKRIGQTVPCPMGVTPAYLDGWEGAVLLPPVPPYKILDDHLNPWSGRDIWLEVDTEGAMLRLSENGCSISPWEVSPDEQDFYDEKLCCHYRVKPQEETADFYLYRTYQDTQNLLVQGKDAGVKLAVGLYQQWSDQLVLFESKLS